VLRLSRALTYGTCAAGVLLLHASRVGAAEAPDPFGADPRPAMERAIALANGRLRGGTEPIHHLAYAVHAERRVTLQGTNGAFGGREASVSRLADIELRVGTPRLDNTHKLRDSSGWSEPDRPNLALPLTDGGPPLFELLVRGTDELYRSARKRLMEVRANDAVKVAREDTSDDFSPSPVVVGQAPVPTPAFDESAWKSLVIEASRVWLDTPGVMDSAVQVTVTETRRWLADADGTRIADGRNHLRVATWGSTVAPDGMQLQVYDYVDAASLEGLPDRAAVLAMTRRAAAQLAALRDAPIVEPYAGPAILRGRAAGVFFHEIFGHRIEGHRQKDEDEGQTFTRKVGQAVLPDFLSVVDDPTVAQLGAVDLNGHYRWDDEGVAAQRVTLVDRGILRGFLLSRAPIAGFGQSNGHGRRQPGNAPVARQGNLMVEAHRTVPYETLRQMLVAEVKKQGKPYGLVFDDISGGFTFTGRSTPNAFAVQPVTVWRVYPDGRPDELVRGVDMIGTPLTTFSRILAAGDDRDVFNGSCGAESGWVPVSASSPSLLVGEIEVQRREKGNDRPPILPEPGRDAAPKEAR
jgi:predicted Zn-dependent protease